MSSLSIENRAALRTALAAVTSLIIAFACHLDKPYWSGMTVVLVANLYTGDILVKALMRVVGTVAGALIGYFLSAFVVDSLLLYFFLNFFIVAIAVYYYNFSKYAYAWLLGAIAAFIVISGVAITPEEVLSSTIWRPIEITLGVIVSSIFAFFVLPNRITDKTVHDVNLIFAAVDALFVNLDRLLTEQDHSIIQDIKEQNLQLKNQARQSLQTIVLIRYEFELDQTQLNQYRFLLDSCLIFCRALNYFLSLNAVAAIDTALSMKETISAIRCDISNLKANFFNIPSSIQLLTESALNKFDQQYSRTLSTSPDDFKSAKAWRHFFYQTNRMLMGIQISLIGSSKHSNLDCINTSQQLKQDYNVITHSIKAGLTTVLALGLWLFINIPGGLNGIISSIVISARRNLYDMQNTGSMRLLGCLLGGGTGLYIMMTFTMSLYLLLVIIFLTVWAFSLFSFSKPNYAYVGMQANVAIILVMAEHGASVMTALPAIERMAGIVIGIVASFVVANLIWRMSLSDMIYRYLSKLQLNLAHNVACLLADNEKKEKYLDLIDTFWTCRELLSNAEQKYALAHTPRAQWTPRQWQIHRARERERLLNSIQVTLNNIRESMDRKRALKSACAYGIDLSVLERKILELYCSKSSHSILTPDHPYTQQALEILMEVKGLSESNHAELENCAAYVLALEQLEVNGRKCY
ncbi:FUSC family protein [Legionella longbeachae]|uniref:FUSC family protein n=1 Tax=Legionella longbeachae TaxID=450 RepID=UPI0001BEB855|nr:FUSC family protein [Legionella longbeachae]EEZ94204.1 putative membrane protein [Legionella longbeachae D-4968]UAK46225.1 FUSC family protein [Legionella longbeachae]VEE03210.1 p-hydroxybenzoic acid efflux pump subunit AaeB [Legionella oakridgensis]HBD7398619.1 FUSC family protein [Legionella pneumophila]